MIDIIVKGSVASYSAIIQEIKLCSLSFNFYSLVHELRNFNFEAHNLAKHAVYGLVAMFGLTSPMTLFWFL